MSDSALRDLMRKSKDTLRMLASSPSSTDPVHVVLGNESCDLDSVVSALCFSLVLSDLSKVVLPVLNIRREEFLLKTEVSYLLKNVDFDVEELIFRDDVDLAALQASGRLRLTLVDHHVLPEKDRALFDSLVGIVDHRPLDASLGFPAGCDVDVRTVGSCASLVGERILEKASHNLDRQVAYLIRGTILLDTGCLSPQMDRTTALDVSVVTACEERAQITESRADTFERIVSARKDISFLTSFQILHKDLKVVRGLPIPGMPILLRDFLERPDAAAALAEFCAKHKSDTAVVMGMSFLGENVRRELAIYSKEESHLAKMLIEALTQDKSLLLTQVPCQVEGITLFDQKNTKHSRKQIIPIVQNVLART